MPDVRHHTVQVPATSANLGPGFDAFGLALTRYLVVRSVPRGSQLERVVSRGEGAGEVSAGDDNLIWRSLVAYCEAHDRPVPDVALRAVNDLPLERGLGSSSAAIVAGLVLGRSLTGMAVSDLDLVVLADDLEGHPDNVAPAILGGLVAGARGETGFVVRRINPLPGHVALAFVPPVVQSTEASRTSLPAGLDREAVVDQVARAGHVLVGLTGAWGIDPTLVGDRLHEPVRTPGLPDGGALLDGLRRDGFTAWLSGSGPVVIALAREGDQQVVADARSRAAAGGCELLVLALDRLGALACPDGGCALSGVGGCAQCPRERL